tara:strand:+ start:3288 stop:4196 length:909 start_codon:yes stop_codon:yes gene_type:complete
MRLQHVLFSSLLLLSVVVLACQRNPNPEPAKSISNSISEEAGNFKGEGEPLAPSAAASMLKTNNNNNGSIAKVARQQKQKLIKKGNLTFETDSLERSSNFLYTAALQFNGYISTDKQEINASKKTNDIEIRVPSDQFDALVTAISNEVKQFDRKDIQVNDVTDQFVDVQARLKTKETLVEHYLQLLNKAKNIEEILKIERQIAPLREEIEAMKGRLKWLTDQTSYSTLKVHFYRTIPAEPVVVKDNSPSIVNAFKNGWTGLVYTCIALVNFWPLLLLIISFFLIYKRMTLTKQKQGLNQERF